MSAHRFPTNLGRGVDQPRTLVRRTLRKATALTGEEIRLPAACTVLFIETSPFTAGQAFLFFGKPEGLSGVALVGDVTDGIDIASFRTIRVPPGVDTVYVWSTVAPGVTTGFAVVAFIGDGWADAAPGALTAVAANATIIAPLGPHVTPGVLVDYERAGAVTEGVAAVTDAGGTVIAANANRLGGVVQNHSTEFLGISHVAATPYASCPIKIFTQGGTYNLSTFAFFVGKLVHLIRDAGKTGDAGYMEYAE